MPDFSSFLALRFLYLYKNKLTEVPGYLLPNNRFFGLDFRNNSLNRLGWDWSETQMDGISELKVDGNPLDCACPMPERLMKIVGKLEKPEGYICVPKLNSSIYHWQHPLEALDFIQTTFNNSPQKCLSKSFSEQSKTNNSINFSLFLLPILLITIPLIIGILMLLNSSKWNDLHYWSPTTNKSSMLAYEPLQIENRNEENNTDNV
uniref:LRRCT domain-containing protein n=1 Tax=Meloidogyne hapla TaxID=6305 RepID=A0A1I8BA35_MELHA